MATPYLRAMAASETCCQCHSASRPSAYWFHGYDNTAVTALLPHQKWIHPCPPPRRPRLRLIFGRAWEHDSASSVACSPSIQPAGANAQVHESHTNVNIVCYPIRKIKHVNLCLIAPRSAVWTFRDLRSIRQMEHWDTLKSLYSQRPGGWKPSEQYGSESKSSHFTKTLESDSSFFFSLSLCQTLGDSSTMSSSEKICLTSYASEEQPASKRTVALFKTSLWQ